MRKLKGQIRIPKDVPRQEGVWLEPQTLAPRLGVGSEPSFLALLASGQGQSCPEKLLRRPLVPVSLSSALPLPA